MGTAEKFEDVLVMVGDSGRWQYMVFLYLWIQGTLIGCHHLSIVFLGYTPKHWCSMEGITFPNWTLEEKMNYSIPRDKNGDFESCMIYNLTSGQIDSDITVALNSRGDAKMACTQFEYDADMGWTTVAEWDLVCDRIALLSTIQASYMGGVCVGGLFWGWASDRFGRRRGIIVSSAIMIISSITAAFSVNYMMFIFFRFFVAFSVTGLFQCGFVLVAEIVSPKLRTPFGILAEFPFGIGASVLPLLAYFVKDWEPLQLAISVPSVLLISYYWCIPESPRWLLSKGRTEEAFKVLQKAAKINRKQMPSDSDFMEMLQRIDVCSEENINVEEEKLSVFRKVANVFKEFGVIFGNPQLRKLSLNVYFSWFVVALVYYGLCFNTKNMGGDFYITNFINGFVELVCCVVIIPALAVCGRMKIYSGTFIVGGACCICVSIILFVAAKDALIPLIITLAMSGKFLIAGTFSVAFLYTAELFPTPVRNTALGGAYAFSSVGSMLAPYIVDILGDISPGIPAIIFGAFSVLAGLLSMMLPETHNRKLPEAIEDLESYNKGTKANGEMKEMNT